MKNIRILYKLSVLFKWFLSTLYQRKIQTRFLKSNQAVFIYIILAQFLSSLRFF